VALVEREVSPYQRSDPREIRRLIAVPRGMSADPAIAVGAR
jgi:hypothetical protein